MEMKELVKVLLLLEETHGWDSVKRFLDCVYEVSGKHTCHDIIRELKWPLTCKPPAVNA